MKKVLVMRVTDTSSMVQISISEYGENPIPAQHTYYLDRKPEDIVNSIFKLLNQLVGE